MFNKLNSSSVGILYKNFNQSHIVKAIGLRTRNLHTFSSKTSSSVEQINNSVSKIIEQLDLSITNYLPTRPEYGYTFKLTSKTVSEGTLDEKVHYLLNAKTNNRFFDWGITVSQKLSLLLQRKEVRASSFEVWKGPPTPLRPGMAILPGRVISVDDCRQEVIVREQTRIMDLWYIVKRRHKELFFITAAIPEGRLGYLLWKGSIEPTYPFFAEKLLHHVEQSANKQSITLSI